AQATGATVHLSGEGGADWQYGFDGRRLHDGDTIEIGNLTIAVDHTPGHTPEHLSLKLTDGAAADEPGYLFTGDFVFVGDLGRPGRHPLRRRQADVRQPARQAPGPARLRPDLPGPRVRQRLRHGTRGRAHDHGRLRTELLLVEPLRRERRRTGLYRRAPGRTARRSRLLRADEAAEP